MKNTIKKSIVFGVIISLLVIATPAHAVVRDAATMSDIQNLQSQIDQLKDLNAIMQTDISILKNRSNTAPAQVVTTSVSSPADAGQNVRLDSLEKKVGVLQTILYSMEDTINTTISLLRQLVTKIKL